VGIFVLGVALCLSSAAHAQPSLELSNARLEIRANEVEYERTRDVFVARGNVHLTQGDRELTADWLSFSQRGGRGVASGHVVFTAGGEIIHANFIEFSLSTQQGVLYLARFEDKTNQFRMEGEEILKTGEKSFEFKDGTFTTCNCPDDTPDPWQIRAEHLDLELESYAVARNTTVNVLGVPVLWMPWMAYPIATERKSGLLFPKLGYSKRSGYTAGLPLFWAARPGLNLTFTPSWFQLRGIKGDVEAEYVLGEESKGTIAAAYIHDSDIDGALLEGPFDRSRDRWSVRGRQDFHLPQGWRMKSDFKFMSDNEYALHFSELSKYRRDRYMGSNLFVTKHFGDSGRVGFVGSALVADDIQNPDFQDRDDFMLHRLPNLEVTVLPAPSSLVKQLVPSLDIQYTYFGQWENPSKSFAGETPVGDSLFFDFGIDATPDANEGSTGGDAHEDNLAVFGGPEGNGVFEEGEPLADRGQRLQLAPRLAVPWRLGPALEIYPEVGWRHTVYETRAQGLKEWGALTARADLRTRLKRSFLGGMTHILEPRVGYGLLVVPNISRDPLFVPFTAVPQRRLRQYSLDNVTRDESDRIEDFNGMTFAIGNRFYQQGGSEQGPRLLADFNLGTQYDLKDGKLGNIILDGMGELSPLANIRFILGWDPEETQLDEAFLDLNWSNGRNWSTGFSYRYIDQIPHYFEDFDTSGYNSSDDRFKKFQQDFNHVNQAEIRLAYVLNQNWVSRYHIRRSFETAKLLTHRGSIEYLSKCNCWGAGIEVRQNQDLGFEVGFIYRITGLGNDMRGVVGAGFSSTNFLDGN
jgi:lipopolysaccharide assembly outer membrane protein LptD (OstA)